MSAKNAVLGLVIEQPGHGYDLARRLEARFGSSGFAPTGVYSALDQLSAEELVRSSGSRSDGESERAAPRRIYEATPKGIDYFEEWMLGSSTVGPVRDELYMKVSLSRPHNLPRLIELARAQEEDCLTRLQDLKRPPQALVPGGPRAWSEVAVLLVRDAEVRQLQARVEWLQKARAVMQRLNSAQSQGLNSARSQGASVGGQVA